MALAIGDRRHEAPARRRRARTVVPALGELEEGFLGSREYDPTQEIYRQDLASYLEWCQAEEIDPTHATGEHLDRWRDWMLYDQVDRRTRGPETQRIGLSGSVVRKRIGVVSQFFEYLNGCHVRSDNPALKIERPPAEDPDAPAPRWLSLQQTLAILDAAKAQGAIEHALACLLFAYGQPAAHVGELYGRDVFDRDGKPHIQLTMRRGRKLTQPLVGRTALAIAALGELSADEPLIALPGSRSPSAFRRRVMRTIVACSEQADVEAVNLIVVRHTWQALARLAEVPEDVIVRHSGIEWSAREQWQQAASASVAVERLLGTPA